MKKKLYSHAAGSSAVRKLSFAVVLVFILSLIPILLVSFYSHPSYDDYSYSNYVHTAVVEGGNLFSILSAAARKVSHTYSTWQGTFSAIFIFALQPGSFSPHAYFLTTFIMVGALTLSTVFLIYTVFVKLLRQRRAFAVIIAMLTLLFQIQFVPDKAQAFYWFNGSSYYTLFYSFALLFFALLIRLSLTEKRKTRIWLTAACCCLAVIIGGGNYTTALSTSVVLFFALLLLIYKKHPHKASFVIVFAFLAAAFAISMIAPGNSVRAAKMTETMSPPAAVVYSFYYSFVLISQWIELPQIIGLIFITPILFVAASKCGWSFKYPVLAIVISLCCFATQLTPPLYAMAYIGDGRQVNIYYYAYHLLILFQLFYICGWLNNRCPNLICGEKLAAVSVKYLPVFSLCFVVLVFAGSLDHGMINLTSVDTAVSFATGEAKQYDAEYMEILASLDNDESVCYISEVETLPDFFNPIGLADYSGYWVNQAVAWYYGHDEAILIR